MRRRYLDAFLRPVLRRGAIGSPDYSVRRVVKLFCFKKSDNFRDCIKF
jgi:hypothetical protein